MLAIKPKNKKQEIHAVKLSKEIEDKTTTIPSNTPTSFTDHVVIAKALDGSILLRLISDIPDLRIENHRTVMKESLAKKLIDILCQLTKHYPQKPKKMTSIKRKPITQTKKQDV